MTKSASKRWNHHEDMTLIGGPPGRLDGPDDLLTVDYSGFAEGYGIQTFSFAADPNGGFRGTYFLDGTTRTDFLSVERFAITGTNYADAIQVGNNNDTVTLGGGNDTVIAGLGRDNLNGGAGIDGFNKTFSSTGAVSVNLETDTITAAFGTVRNFEYFFNVVGSTRNDVFVSSLSRGNDVVSAGDGNDRFESTRGDDDFNGGAGVDSMKRDFSWYEGTAGIQMSFTAESSGQGFRGYYYVDGAERSDFTTTENFEILGTKNNDDIVSGTGNDALSGNGGDDNIRSGAGNDALDGGDGIDGVGRDFGLLTVAVTIDLAANSLTGGGGTIANFEYFSDMIGGSGNDVFVGTAARANDRVTGGSGNDTATFFDGDDDFAGGLGVDRSIVDFSASNTNVGIITSLTSDANGGYAGYHYVDGDTRVDFTSVEAFTITGTRFDDQIQTGDFDDVVRAGDGFDRVIAGGGADTLDGGAGLDGVGRNFINNTNTITIDLGAGTAGGTGGTMVNFEYFIGYVGGVGADRLTSTRFVLNDTASLGGGNDSFVSYAGRDTIAGGLGNDRLIVDYSDIDTGRITTSFAADSDGGFRGYYYAQSNAAYVDFTSIEAFTVTGTRFGDDIVTGSGNDTLNGGVGNDTLNAGAGEDALDGGAGIDGMGKDFTSSRADLVIDLQDNTIVGDDTTIANIEYFLDVRGGSGNDRFTTTTRQANDIVRGGAGNDTGYFFSGDDDFFADSGRDLAVIDFSGIDNENAIQSSVTEDADNGGFKGYWYVDGGNRVDFTGLESVELTGTKNNDGITGTGGNDVLNGVDGRDTINGGDGNDRIDGGAASDTITGGVGADQITGGAAGDVMTGNEGADKFLFGPGDVNANIVYADRITDFATGQDQIDLVRIDANLGTAGNQAFDFIGAAAFSAAGQVRFVNIGGQNYVVGNVDADLGADFYIRVDTTVPVEADFRL